MISLITKSHKPLLLRSLPLDRQRHNVPHPLRDLGSTVTSNPSINCNFEPGTNLGIVFRLNEGGFLIFWGRGGPIKLYFHDLLPALCRVLLYVSYNSCN